MNLERAIEQDMKRFLDGAVHPEEKKDAPRQEDASFVYANKDWEEEIKTLLKRNDIDGAKRTFGQLKEKYNQTPEDHKEERKRMYELVQTCYLHIVNFMQDRERTTELLTRMEQAPTDVFNINVAPVNLQVVESRPRPQSNDAGPITREQLQRQLAGGGGLSLPQPQVIVVEMNNSNAQPRVEPARVAPIPSVIRPAAPAVQPAQPAQPQMQMQQPVPVVAPVIAAPIIIPAAPQQSGPSDAERRERSIVSAVHASIKRCLEMGKTDPSQALAELKELGNTILSEEQQLHVSRLTSRQLLSQIEELERSIRNFKERQGFTRDFNASFSDLVSLARTKDPRAINSYETLRAQAEQFEKSNVGAHDYTTRLDTLRDEFGLFSEDEVIIRVAPLIKRLKIAKQTGSLNAYDQTLADLERFTKTLPHTAERDMLEQTTRTLRKSRMTKLS